MKWRVGVVTAPREKPTLERTIESIRGAGWSDIFVRGEPRSPIPKDVVSHVAARQCGVAKNTLALIRMLLDDESDAMLICQDDVLLSVGCREYVERTWPINNGGLGLLWLYRNEPKTKADRAWVRLPNTVDGARGVYGSLAVVLTQRLAEMLERDEPLGQLATARAGWDTQLIRWAATKTQAEIYHHDPSLAQHIGETSVLHQGMKITRSRRAADNWHRDVTKLSAEADGTLTIDDVTACVTTYKRPQSLNRLLASIREHYPDLKLEVQDTKGNLSWGRNELVKRCETRVCLILEDDFQFTVQTRLEAILRVLNMDPEVGVVGGALISRPRRHRYVRDYHLHRGVLESHYPPHRKWKDAGEGVRYRYVDKTSCFLACRTNVLREEPWDERLELAEHEPWFWKIKEAGKWRVAWTDSVQLRHLKDEGTEEYQEARGRHDQFKKLWGQWYPFHQVVNIDNEYPTVPHSPLRASAGIPPNILILATGHTGSRLLVQMLKVLGWNDNEPEPHPFHENREFNVYNRRIMVDMDEMNPNHERLSDIPSPPDDGDGRELEEFLESLERPWVLKDPRLVFVMGQPRWQELLKRHQPLLIHLTRGRDAIRRSYLRRGANPEKLRRGRDVRTLTQLTELEFDAYPYAKVSIAFEQLVEMFKLVDFERAEA